MKERIKKISNRLSFFKRLVITSLIPSFCAIVMLFVAFFPLSLAVARKNDKANEDILSRKIEEELQKYETVSAEVVSAVENTKWLHPMYFEHILHGEPVSPQTKREISNDLRVLVLKNSRVQAVTFRFYGEEDMLYGSGGIYSNLDLHRQMSDDLKFRFFSASEYSEGLFGVRAGNAEYLIFCAPFRDIPEGRAKGEVNVVLSTGQMEELLSAEGVSGLCVYNARGDTVLSCGAKNGTAADTEVSGEILTGGYRYVYSIPQSLHSRNRLQIKAFMIPAILIVTALVAVLSYVFSKGNYRPVTTVVSALSETPKEIPKKISVATLEDLVDSILVKKQETEKQIEMFRPLARQNMLGGLLSGEAFPSGYEKRAEACGLIFEGSRYTVLAFEDTEGEKKENASDFPALPVFAFDAGKAGSSDNKMYVYVYRDYSGKYLILVNYSEKEQLESFISGLGDEFDTKAVRNNGISIIRCGVGAEAGSLEEVCRSAEQASTALSYAVLNQTAEFVRWNDIADTISSGYSYTFLDERLLSSSIMAGDREGSVDIVKRIVNQNIKAVETDPRVIKSLYYDIRSTVIRSRQKKGLHTETAEQSAKTPEGFTELIDMIGRQIGEICDMINRNCSYPASVKNAEILDYIDRNIFNYDLSLARVSERFRVSETYVSKLFKNQRAVNYSGYVNGKRIEKAVEIISEERPPINTVYKRVGYISDSTFRRNFIKYTGKNPSDL